MIVIFIIYYSLHIPVKLTELYYLFYYLLARSTSEGEIGNFVQFEKCIFESNSALLYGGAVSMSIPSANITFGDRRNINAVEFESWQVGGYNRY